MIKLWLQLHPLEAASAVFKKYFFSVLKKARAYILTVEVHFEQLHTTHKHT